MGYQFSNQTKTLTHWQSGAASAAPVINTSRKQQIAGFYSQGDHYLFPFECWDTMSEAGFKYHGVQYYGFSLDLSERTPIASMRQLSPDGTITYYRAVYNLYENAPLQWKTARFLRTDPVVVTDSISIKQGETTGVAIPYFSCYALVQGHISTEQCGEMPSYMNDYPLSEREYTSYDTAPALKPELFNSLGKKRREWKIIEASALTYKTTDAMFGMRDINGLYYSGGYSSSVPLTVGASNNGESVKTSSGSCVDYNNGNPFITPHANFSIGTTTIRDYSEYVGDGIYSIYITREPVQYELTTGILWETYA